MYIVNFAMCFTFVSFRPELFLLCKRNSPKEQFSFHEQLKCQTPRVKRMETCSASAFSPHSYLPKISAYFCFSKAIHWTTHFYFFGSKFKEIKVVDAAPLGHLICNSWRVRPEMENYNVAIQVVIIIRVTRLFLNMPGPLSDPDWLGIII